MSCLFLFNFYWDIADFMSCRLIEAFNSVIHEPAFLGHGLSCQFLFPQG